MPKRGGYYKREGLQNFITDALSQRVRPRYLHPSTDHLVPIMHSNPKEKTAADC